MQRCHNWLHTLHTVGMMKILLKLHRLLQKFYFELLAKVLTIFLESRKIIAVN